VLDELRIEQLGVIETLDLVIGAGLTALTGETGAGKTMVVEAISLLVGGRADGAMVRPDAAEARIEGRFVIDGEEHVVTRVIPADGRSRAYVDGRLATVDRRARPARSTSTASMPTRACSAAAQRGALDRFAGTDQPLRRPCPAHRDDAASPRWR
jgi:DNA repair protein RecN (Recombination protein N)